MSVTSVPVFWGAAFSCGSAACMDGTMDRLKKKVRKNHVNVEPLSDARTSLVKSASRRAGVGG
jgi:hypothetical protein